jgi:hypothetical protein
MDTDRTREARSPGTETGGSCRVLVVEDDGTIAANLHEYLEARGFTVCRGGPARRCSRGCDAGCASRPRCSC